jgi:phosphoglycolate phosphatase-like HAD superfamily hydrolase
MAIKAIIFDIDGVLADSRLAVIENTKQLLREFDFDVAPGRVDGMSSAHSAESVLVALAPALSQDSALLGKMLARLSKITKDNLHLVKPTGLAARVPEFAAKYRIAAATNRKGSARMVLERLGIEKYFRAVLTSADAPHKPDPAMIRLALARLGVDASEAVFVGDNEEDVAAGRAAGVETVMLDGTKKVACDLFAGRFLD